MTGDTRLFRFEYPSADGTSRAVFVRLSPADAANLRASSDGAPVGSEIAVHASDSPSGPFEHRVVDLAGMSHLQPVQDVDPAGN